MKVEERKEVVLQGLGYAGCVGLVFLYVGMFSAWRFAGDIMDTKTVSMLPLLITLLLLALIITVYFTFRRNVSTVGNKYYVIAGVAICLAALTIPDPSFPVKRIHVAEYMLLALVTRFAMSFRMQGLTLLFFSALFTCLLGVHDELLQGFHPARTYGLRDIFVNTLGSCGGAMIWHGFQLFQKPWTNRAASSIAETRVLFLYIFWLTMSIVAFIWPLAYYRSLAIPLWPASPLIGSLLFFFIYADRFKSVSHGIRVVSLTSFTCAVYPLISHSNDVIFY